MVMLSALLCTVGSISFFFGPVDSLHGLQFLSPCTRASNSKVLRRGRLLFLILHSPFGNYSIYSSLVSAMPTTLLAPHTPFLLSRLPSESKTAPRLHSFYPHPPPF